MHHQGSNAYSGTLARYQPGAAWRLGATGTLAALFFLLAVTLASAGIQPRGGNWLVIASRASSGEALEVARDYAGRFAQTTVFQSNNGWFAITLGWLDSASGEQIKAGLISRRLIPGDSYLHNGQRFSRVIWSATGVPGEALAPLLAATRYGSGGVAETPPVASADPAYGMRGYVTGLNPAGDNYLSLRSGPGGSSRELLRMGPNTPLTILGRSGSWYQVRLDSGQAGWAHSRYVALSPAAASPVAAPVTPQPAPQVVASPLSPDLHARVGDLTGTSDSYLSLRGAPTARSAELARLLPRTPLTLTAQAEGWYEARLDNGVTGWVSAAYVDIVARTAEVTTYGPQGTPESGSQTSSADPQPSSAEASADGGITHQEAVAPAFDGKRVALVLGNSRYEHAPELPNPKNDAADISDSLKGLGFEVITALDGTKAGMERSIRDFVRALPGAKIALFFYAGHAMQVDGVNHLIPIDASLEDQTAVDFETIRLDTVLDFMNAPDRLSIALLDACRDNPLSRRFTRSMSATRSAFIGRGLAAPAIAGGNILIGYATSPGEVALDGAGDNSPFTTALLRHMSTRGLEVELMMKRVKADVFEETGGQQAPWHNSALRDEFYFASAPAAPQAESAGADAQ
ncbi:caspase family protein [Roseibium aestuarii]|uniref:Caspase family protein n=1 Tax=Roseibium aestuarii TaxID=2600299 RepID=A0ABW4JVD2_9HYPH|nr:caspase family protein [Roseibium aestuarii]